jgi:hypothetical protein
MIQTSIGPCRVIDGATSSLTLANTCSSGHSESATMCMRLWCCAGTHAGFVATAIVSALRRPGVQQPSAISHQWTHPARMPDHRRQFAKVSRQAIHHLQFAVETHHSLPLIGISTTI